MDGSRRGSRTGSGEPCRWGGRELQDESLARLRREAEMHVEGALAKLSDRIPEDSKEIVHELQVHMMELELQNVELSEIRGELEETWQRYWDLFYHAPLGYLTLDKSGHVELANDRAAQLLGHSHSRLKDMSLYPLIDERDRDTYYKLLRKVGQGKAAEAEVRLAGAGGLRWLLLKARLEPEGDRILLTAMDMSDRKHAEQSLRELSERAEKADKAKSLFLANMSHEIRTPMNGVLGMIGLALRAELPTKTRQQLEIAEQAGYRLLEIINDILDLSKIEAGKMVLEDEDFDLPGMLESLEMEFSAHCREAGLEFVLAVDPRLPGIARGDALRLRQVLGNLLSNALKFTRKGGIRLSAELAGMGSSEGRVRPGVLFTVTDTGIGIPEAIKEHVFNDFTQGEENLTKRFKGTGLGLSICKRLVGLFGGEIGFESSEGSGSSFFVRLPLAIGTQGRACCELDDAVRLPPLKFLLVEDEAINQCYMTQMLRLEGHEVTLAQTGLAALEQLAACEFDAVLMDVQMPVMDGGEATRRIRNGDAGEKARLVPIIGLSAYAMREDEKRYLSEGMDAYVTKPVLYHALAQAVARARQSR